VKIIEYFALCILTIILLLILSQVPLLQNVIAASGYSANEVWSGIAIIAIVIYTFMLAVSGGK
jgi:hypothetical protein